MNDDDDAMVDDDDDGGDDDDHDAVATLLMMLMMMMMMMMTMTTKMLYLSVLSVLFDDMSMDCFLCDWLSLQTTVIFVSFPKLPLW